MSSFKTYIEIEVEVDYDYQPFEPQSKDCPETYAEVTICAVELDTYDISTLLRKSILEELEQQCFEDQRTDQ